MSEQPIMGTFTPKSDPYKLKEHGGLLGLQFAVENDRLKALNAELAEALTGILDASNGLARATMSYDNARNNFSDSADEKKAYARAVISSSEAEKKAREALAKHKETT